MADGMDLGSARFVVQADTTQFAQGIDQAEAKARTLGNSVGVAMRGVDASINQHSQSAARGLLQLGYAIDDIQYGFHGIVNNIPQIVLGLGGGAGLAGVVSILSVAANQLAQHWDAIFADNTKLPTIKEGLDGLAASLDKIREKLEPLKKARDEILEGERGTFAELMDRLGVGEGSLPNRERLRKLEELEREAKDKLRDEKILEGAGPEHTEAARKTAGLVRGAVAKLPEGSETLVGTLMARGMSYDEARKAVAGSLRGHAGNLDDVLAKLTPDEKRGKFADLARASIEGQKQTEREKEGEKQAAAQRKLDDEREKGQEKELKRIRNEVKERVEAQHKARIEAIQDRQQKLQDEREDREYQRQLREINGRTRIFNSPMEYAMAAQQGGGDNARKLLDENRTHTIQLREIRDALQKERRNAAKFGGN